MSKFEGKLLGMGNPLLDISATVKQDILDKYDVKLDSAILAEDKHQPLYKELVDNYDVQYIAGGATQNSMRVAQWMLTAAGKPNMVAFMGCVGPADDYAKQLENCASSDGVLVHYMKDESTPTGTCAALIMNKERALVANLAAANNFHQSHLETDKAKEIIDSVDIYYSAGFFLTVSVESLVQVATKMIEQNKIVALNLSAPFIVDFFGDQLSTAIEYADYVFGNENEGEAYGKKNLNGEQNLGKIALHISTLPKKNNKRNRIVIFTQGSKCTIVAIDGQVKEYPVTPIPSDQLVDTNGAGDAFVGGFLAQKLLNKDLDSCIKAAHWAASYIIQQSGTTLSGPCEYSG